MTGCKEVREVAHVNACLNTVMQLSCTSRSCYSNSHSVLESNMAKQDFLLPLASTPAVFKNDVYLRAVLYMSKCIELVILIL